MKLVVDDEGTIWSINAEVVATHFNSKTRQLMEVKGNYYIYYKDEVRLFSTLSNNYIHLLLKLTTITIT